MSFEEFFEKKKINLHMLKDADGDLFLKLSKEYQEMGAKSFDHYYKFLFNKWRRRFTN